MHSLTKGLIILDKNYEEINSALNKSGLALETSFNEYTPDRVDELWVSFRSLMPKSSWGMSRYWDFIYSDTTRPDEIKSHDVHCIKNLIEKTQNQSDDELGIMSWFRGNMTKCDFS